jgi:hypothetical protein
VFGQVNWAGPLPGSRPAWYLTYEYLGRDQTCDLHELQVALLTVPLFPEGRGVAGGRAGLLADVADVALGFCERWRPDTPGSGHAVLLSLVSGL